MHDRHPVVKYAGCVKNTVSPCVIRLNCSHPPPYPPHLTSGITLRFLVRVCFGGRHDMSSACIQHEFSRGVGTLYATSRPMNSGASNSGRIPIACRLLATDQWLRTHVSPCVLMRYCSLQPMLTGPLDIALPPDSQRFIHRRRQNSPT
jgi:hypothetical protein